MLHRTHVIMHTEAVAMGQVVVAHGVVQVVLPEVLARRFIERRDERIERLRGDVADSVGQGRLVLQHPMSFALAVCCGHVEVVLEVVEYFARRLVVVVESHRGVVWPDCRYGTLPRGDSGGEEHGADRCT